MLACVVSFSFAQDDTTTTGQADTAVVRELLGTMRNYQYSGDDTYVQMAAKQRQLRAALALLNARYKGKTLVLQQVRLDDVIPEGGRYEAAYSIHYGSSFEYLTVEIFKIYPNEHSVIDFKKGDTVSVSGRIDNIAYVAVSDRLIIRLK